MKNYITRKYAPEGELNVLETTSATEVRIRMLSPEALPQEHVGLVRAIAEAMEEAKIWRPVAILTSFDVRRALRAAIEIEFPHVPVLSREEVFDIAAMEARGSIVWE